MALSRNDYAADGSTSQFAVTFPFISRSHVKGYVDGVEAPLTWISDALVDFDPIADIGLAGTTILIERRSSPTVRLVNYNTPGTLTAENLNTDSKQAFYLMQEATDDQSGAMGLSVGLQWDANNLRLVNLADGVGATDAVTKQQFDVGVAAAAPLAAAAAASAAAALAAKGDAEAAEANIEAQLTGAALTGAPTTTTPSGGDDSTRIANTAWVRDYVETVYRRQATASSSLTGLSQVEFTSIPSWAKRITFLLEGLSTGGSNPILVQLGTGGVPTTSGYGGSITIASGGVVSMSHITAGFSVGGSGAVNINTGRLVVEHAASNRWVGDGAWGYTNTPASGMAQGSVNLAGVLNYARIVSADTFDGGTVTAIYEG